MNRRNFLKLFATASAAVGLGVATVELPQAQGPYSVRYLEAYDIHEGRLKHRIDIAQGFDLAVPVQLEVGKVYRNARADQIEGILHRMSAEVKAIDPAAVAAILTRLPKEMEIMGVCW